jgi:hypothetical protein
VEGEGIKPKPKAVGRFSAHGFFIIRPWDPSAAFFVKEAIYVNRHGRKSDRRAA